VIADDHAVVRRGVRAMLESQPGIEICAEASDGLETVDSIKKEKPDLLVLGLTMPKMNGLEVIRSVREESPSTDILVLTMHFSDELARECRSFGARAYILKSDAGTELLAAVDSLRYHQRPYFTCQLAVIMTETLARAPVPGVEKCHPRHDAHAAGIRRPSVARLWEEQQGSCGCARRFDQDNRKPQESHHG
jgi:DNA-binding NarL/FixJ family response regulator